MIDAFREGYEEFINGDALFAAQKFNEAELLFPQSSWAPKAALMAAYVYYAQDYYFDAESELERFIKTYPKNENFSIIELKEKNIPHSFLNKNILKSIA